MRNFDGDRLPPCHTWQQTILKASSYAAASLNHPLYQVKEKERQISAYSLAFLDCLGSPKLVAVDSSHWTGRIGEKIHLHFKENIHVMHVRVMFNESETSETVLESGFAYPSRLNPLIWTYITQTEICQTPGLCMYVLANDIAGNLGTDSVVFNYE